MKILSNANVVHVRKDGKWSHYSLSEEGLQYAIQYLQKIKRILVSIRRLIKNIINRCISI